MNKRMSTASFHDAIKTTRATAVDNQEKNCSHDLIPPSDWCARLIMTLEALDHDIFSRCHHLLMESAPGRSSHHHIRDARLCMLHY
mmetsp:Transcript_12424/g.24831  ORF Transcript_12424/g.24831 Transcript_12424/m.24831 type:complete len:86 (+) Transcript_12424:1276-1533(+)